VFDYSKYYNEIVDLDPDARCARVQPGVICDQLRNAAEEFNLTYGPDPATHEYCTFGGMLGNNSCGTHSLMAGKTSDNVIELDVVLYDGTRMTVGETSDEELERRRAAWRKPPPRYERGYGRLFSEHVSQANEGCDFDFLERGAPTADPEIH